MTRFEALIKQKDAFNEAFVLFMQGKIANLDLLKEVNNFSGLLLEISIEQEEESKEAEEYVLKDM